MNLQKSIILKFFLNLRRMYSENLEAKAKEKNLNFGQKKQNVIVEKVKGEKSEGTYWKIT